LVEAQRNDQREIKGKTIMVRVDDKLKQCFFEKCRTRAINPSAWLRLQIERFVQES